MADRNRQIRDILIVERSQDVFWIKTARLLRAPDACRALCFNLISQIETALT